MERTEAEKQLETIIVDFNNLLKDVELKTIEEIWPPGSSNKPWFKSKPWFTKDLLYLSKSQKIIMNVQKATGVYYRQELNKIRSEFRILKKNEITKLKNREREKLRDKYKTCRLKFWKEIGRRKSKVANVNIDQDTLVGHFKDLFCNEISSDTNQDFDSEMKRILTSEMKRIELDQRIYTQVSVTDIATIMKELPLNKSPGPAKVRAGLLKYSIGSRSEIVVSKIMDCLLNNRLMPKNMNQGRKASIIKDPKSPTKSITNVRGITLSDILSVIFERTIALSY